MRWQRNHIQIQESVLTVLCARSFKRTAVNAVLSARSIIETYSQKNPQFACSFVPVPVAGSAPELIRKMCHAAQVLSVGPMASVAGAIAEYTLTALLDAGAAEAVVDNGGDIVLKVNEPVHIGIYSGCTSINNLAFRIEPTHDLLSVCTSSGTVGHSFSYGRADTAIAISTDACMADAAATALGNRIKTPTDLAHAFDFLKARSQVRAALVICKNKIGLFGELPQLVYAQINDNYITKGKRNGKN